MSTFEVYLKSRDYPRHSKKKGRYITYVLKECAGSTMLR